MNKLRERAKQELRGYLDEEDEDSSPINRRVEQPRDLAAIPQKETIRYCDDLLGQKLEVFKQIKQRFEDSQGFQQSLQQSHQMSHQLSNQMSNQMSHQMSHQKSQQSELDDMKDIDAMKIVGNHNTSIQNTSHQTKYETPSFHKTTPFNPWSTGS